MPIVARYGWKPDSGPKDRDLRLRAVAPFLVSRPPVVDLTPLCPPVVDQGDLGSCTANAIAAALLFAGMRQDGAPVELSRLFIYYNERAMEGTIDEDAGAEIRDGIKSVAKQGACLELAWPYVERRFRDKPDLIAYHDASTRQAVRYYRVEQDAGHLESCLAAGYPIVFGFTVYPAFESDEVARTGIVPMPKAGEQEVGGHAVLLVGYDQGARTFLVRNSWGHDWGTHGYFTMPYGYVLGADLADDFWTIRQVE